ncbi:MAG: FAD binding domain-containing protein [Bacillus sp. (in: firmicutes)]
MEFDSYQTVVHIPKTLVEVKKIYQKDSLLISGGTFVQLNWEAGLKRPAQMISMEKITELAGITETSNASISYLEIGAATTLAECCTNRLVQKHAKLLADACRGDISDK